MTSESLTPDINYQLFSIAMDIRRGDHPYPRELIRETGDWMVLAHQRHKASIALVHAAPANGFTREQAINYVFENSEESPLLKEEGSVLIENGLILPYPNKGDKPEIVMNRSSVPSFEGATLGPITKDSGQLEWFEPSLVFATSGIEQQIDNGKTVGFTSVKCRIITAIHMKFFWEMRKRCDYMVVALDSESYDKHRVVDGFTPNFADKASFLRAIDFPDKRKIDLITPTHGFLPSDWFDELNLPYVAARNSKGLKYFLSERDLLFDKKKHLAEGNGMKVCKINFSKNSVNIHSSKLVKKFNLGKL